MDLSIVIPVYNEEDVLEKNIKEVISFFSRKDFSWELIVVNDGSRDATRDTLIQLLHQFPFVKIIQFTTNQGKGSAVRAGFLQSIGLYMLFFDIDLSVPLLTFDRFWQQKNERTVLIGSRVARGAVITRHQPLIKEWTGRLSNILVRLLLPLSHRDTQCGFKLFPASFRPLLSLTSVSRASFDIEWLLIARRAGFETEEMPVPWANRPDSRFTFIDYFRALYELLVITFNDMKGTYRR